MTTPKGFRDMKCELESKSVEKKQNEWNLSPETLQAMEQNRRDVEVGILSRYVGGGGGSTNQEVEKRGSE